MAKATTVLDYLESEFATFGEAPVNALDACAFAELAMVRAEGLAPLPCHPRDLLLAEHYPEMFGGFIAQSLRRCLVALAASPRFRDLWVEDVTGIVDEDARTQFGAVCVRCPGQFAICAFRGTDGTITGWREDFDMACTWPVPGQAQAAEYLEAIAARTEGPLYVCGHSKGGNLAAYAAAKASEATFARIRRVWDLDGPGFRPEALSAREQARVAPVLDKIIPRDSVVGLVLEEGENWRVVPSTSLSVLQHDAFTWEADLAARDFAHLDAPSASALYARDVVAGWLRNYSRAELALFVETLFRTLRRMAGSDNMSDVFKPGENALAVLAQAAREADGEGRALAVKMLGDLTASAAKTAAATVAGAVQSAIAGAAQAVGEALPEGRASAEGASADEGGPGAQDAGAAR